MSRSATLSWSAKIGYASGNLGKSIQWNTVDFLYLFFLTDIIGIPTATAGMVILASLIWDGISDPFVGYLIDRFGERLGSYQRIILWAAPFSFAGFLAIFALPGLIPTHTVLLAVVAGFAFRTGYTLVDVPHNSLLADITRDSRERSVLSVYRFLFSSLGGIILSLAILPTLRKTTHGEVSDFIVFAAITGTIYVLVMTVSALSSQTAGPIRQRKPSKGSFLQALKTLAGNKRLILISIIVCVTAILVPIFAKMSVFYAKSWLGNPAYASTLIIAYSIGQIASLPLWLHLSTRFEKPTAATISHILMIAICAAFLLLQPDRITTASALFFGAGFAFGGINTMNWAIIPDSIEYTEVASGRRHEALTFGLLLLIMKVSAGLSMALTGWGLHFVEYDPQEYVLGDQLEGMTYLMALAPLIGSLVCIFLLIRLDITHLGHRSLTDGTAL